MDTNVMDRLEQYQIETPAREPNIISDVRVPLLQASITAVVCGFLAAAVGVLFGAPIEWVLRISVFVLALAGAVSWGIILTDNRRLLWSIETATNRDIDGDGEIGEPETPVDSTPHVTWVKDGTRQIAIHWPQSITEKQIRAVARAVLLEGGAFSRPYLCKERKILSQGQFNALSKLWKKRGLARGEGGNRTVITSVGRALLRLYLSPAPDGNGLLSTSGKQQATTSNSGVSNGVTA